MSKYRIALGQNQSLWEKLGPGLITGAADDDPSGIATYSQVGAAFGYGMLWTALFTFPLMVGIQSVSAGIGRVTGDGLAANIRTHYSPWLLYVLVGLLLVANTINIAADIGAMGAALKLLIGGPAHWYAIAFGVVSLVLQVFVPFPRYAPILKSSAHTALIRGSTTRDCGSRLGTRRFVRRGRLARLGARPRTPRGAKPSSSVSASTGMCTCARCSSTARVRCCDTSSSGPITPTAGSRV